MTEERFSQNSMSPGYGLSIKRWVVPHSRPLNAARLRVLQAVPKDGTWRKVDKHMIRNRQLESFEPALIEVREGRIGPRGAYRCEYRITEAGLDYLDLAERLPKL